MKISEMTNDQATEAMIRLSGPFSRICEDEEAVAMIEKARGMGKEKLITTIGKMLPEFVRFGLQKHKNDLYEIVGALLDKPVGAVGRMNFTATVKALRNSYDEILVSFFTHSVLTEAGSGKESA